MITVKLNEEEVQLLKMTLKAAKLTGNMEQLSNVLSIMVTLLQKLDVPDEQDKDN